MINVAIIGATGYGGIELIRILEYHPYMKLVTFISGSHEGELLADIYPHLTNIKNEELSAFNIEQLKSEVEVVFFATPSGVSKEYIPSLIDAGIKCIDLSGDFRLKEPAEYKEWYKYSSADSKYLAKAVYGLSEIQENEIKQAQLIANPGCYPTATLLGLIPIIKAGLIDTNSVIIDGKSGVSGGGRKLAQALQYSEVNESVKAYKLGAHQHIPEIEQSLLTMTGSNMNVSFGTHLIPMTRGLMCTIYCNLTELKTSAEILSLYKEFYENHSFVRIMPEGIWPATKQVYGSNYCDIGIAVDERTQRVIIVSVIDNLVKGAAGQGVQNANIMHGWPVTAGLTQTPLYP